MMEVYLRKGFSAKGSSSYVSQVRKKVAFGEVYIFYNDSNYNIVNMRPYLNALLVDNDFSELNFNTEFTSEVISKLDETALKNDFICRCLVMVWVSSSGEKIITKAGDFINVFEVFEGWAGAYESSAICYFPMRSAADLYIGSGVCLPLAQKVPVAGLVYFISENTESHIDSQSPTFDLNIYNVDVGSSSSAPVVRQRTFNINDYKEFLDLQRLDLAFRQIEKDHFKKGQYSFSQFLAILN